MSLSISCRNRTTYKASEDLDTVVDTASYLSDTMHDKLLLRRPKEKWPRKQVHTHSMHIN